MAYYDTAAHVRVEWWLVAIGFSVMIFCYDEARKFVIRKCPGGKHYTRAGR